MLSRRGKLLSFLGDICYLFFPVRMDTLAVIAHPHEIPKANSDAVVRFGDRVMS
eukprot:COSAG02_NODE_10407_length_1947_cov_1.637446_2_plen_54_part_00